LFKTPAGQVISVDAELFATRLAIAKATATGCPNIVVIMDCFPAAKRAVDTAILRGQEHSITISKLIRSHFETHSKAVFISGTAQAMPGGLYMLRSTTKQLEPTVQFRNKFKHPTML